MVKLWFADSSETPRDFIQKSPDPGDWERSQSDNQEQEQPDQDYTTTTTTKPWSNENPTDQPEKDADGYTSHDDEEDKNQDLNTGYNSGYSYNYDDVNGDYNDKYSALDIKENLPDEDNEGERERNNFGTRRAAIPDLPGEEDDGGDERGDDGVMKSLRDFIRGNHWNKHTKWNSLCNLTTIFALFVWFPFCVWLFKWMFLLINYSSLRVCS